MHPRYAALLILLVLALGPLGAAVPAADGPTDHQDHSFIDAPLLYLKAGTFDPVNDPAPGPTGLKVGSTHPFYVVQFDGPIQKAWREAASDAGADLLEYLPDFGYFARIPARSLGDVEAMDHVRYVGPAHLAYRIDPHLWNGEMTSRDLTAITWDEEAAGMFAYSLMREGALIYGQDADMVTFRTNPVVAIALARDVEMGVAWLEPYFSPEMNLNYDARTSKARQQVDGAYIRNDQSAWSYNAATDAFEGWTGRNVTVADADTGLDIDHPAFDGRITAYYDYGNNGQADNSGHGTHTAGIILGDGSWRPADTGVDGKYSGIAPEADLVVQELLAGYAGIQQANRDASRSGASISSNSWGAGYFGNYDATSRAYDIHTRDSDNWKQGNQPMLFSFSAGNAGAYGSNSVNPPATGKNMITVGATGNDKWGLSSNTVAGFSSRGPTDDGRFKPDIVMPGHQVVAARSTDGNAANGWSRPSDGQTSYVYASGTSMSAPGVAGAAAVLTQYLVEKKDMANPSPAVLKASLINGARPLTGYEYPGHVQGWGTVNLANTIFENDYYKIFRDDQSIGLDTDEGEASKTYWFMVEADQPLKVTLVWTDEGGTGSTGKALINDLDLEIYAPNGSRYAGNFFDSGQSIIDTTFYQDRINNVEGFLINTPIRGIWTINVNCFNAPQGPQDYALVVSGNIKEGHVDLTPSVLKATPKGLEEFHTVRLDTTIKNLGNRAAEVFDYKVEQVDPDGKVTEVSSTNATDLGAGAQTKLGWDFTGKRGTHTLRVTLDPEDLVPESNETNNVIEIEYFFKGYTVRVSVAEPELSTDPGVLVDFNLTVRNRGNVADELQVSISEPPTGWRAQLAADTFLLSVGERSTAVLSVIPPNNALAGDAAEIVVTVTSLGNTTKTRSVTITTTVNQIFGLELTAPVGHLELLPGEEDDFLLRVENPGNGVDRYEILLPQGIDSGWWPSIPEPYVTLEHRSQGDAAFRLAAPDPSPAGSSVTFTLTVKSTKSGIEATVTLSAEVLQFFDNAYQVQVREVEGEVGSTLKVPVTIENNGNGPVEYVLSAQATDPSWEAGFPVPSVTVPGYSWSRLNMSYTVPIDAVADIHDLSIAAMPSGGEMLNYNFTFTVLQYHDLVMTVTSEDATITQGHDFQVEVQLDNKGNGIEEVKVLVPDLPAFWSFDLEESDVDIPPFDQTFLTIIVHTNKDTAGGDYQVGLLARYGPNPQPTTTATAGVTLLTRADLLVRQGMLVIDSVEVLENDLVSLYLEIENSGETAASDLYVQFFVDGLPYGQPIYVPMVDAGEVQNLTSSWTANVTGLHELSVDIDSTDDVDETREDNNYAAVQIKVNKVDYQTSPGPGIMAALVAIAVLAIVADRRQRRHR
jgi:uncharacterized membrane protein/subtilisin family serine protease